MTNPILFETKEREKNIIPSNFLQNNSSSDNSFDNDENHDNFQTASLEKNSSIPRNDIRENDENSPPQENIQNPSSHLNFKNFPSSEASSLKFSDPQKTYNQIKISEGFEEDLPEILQVSNFPPNSSQKQTLKPEHQTNITSTTEKDYFVSSRTTLKYKNYAIFSATTSSDEDIYEGFPHRYSGKLTKTEPIAVRPLDSSNFSMTSDSIPSRQYHSLYLNSSDSVFANSDSYSIDVTHFFPVELQKINE
jgi:hypothetical protein